MLYSETLTVLRRKWHRFFSVFAQPLTLLSHARVFCTARSFEEATRKTERPQNNVSAQNTSNFGFSFRISFSLVTEHPRRKKATEIFYTAKHKADPQSLTIFSPPFCRCVLPQGAPPSSPPKKSQNSCLFHFTNISLEKFCSVLVVTSGQQGA